MQPVVFPGQKKLGRSTCACHVISSWNYCDTKHYTHEHMEFINKESHEVYLGLQLDPVGAALVNVFSLEQPRQTAAPLQASVPYVNTCVCMDTSTTWWRKQKKQLVKYGTCQTLEIANGCDPNQPVVLLGWKNLGRSTCACDVISSGKYCDVEH